MSKKKSLTLDYYNPLIMKAKKRKKKKKRCKLYAIQVQVGRPYSNAPVTDVYRDVFQDYSPVFFQVAKTHQEAKNKVYELCGRLGIVCNGVWISAYKENKKKIKKRISNDTVKDYFDQMSNFY